jgi:hypothetical protein
MIAMTVAIPNPAFAITLFRLGRVSNLPTVWTNVLVGAALPGAGWNRPQFALVLLAMSLFYVGGMYLNDYFDRAIDAQERPERPIPSGAISARSVVSIAGGLLAAGLMLVAATGVLDAIVSALVLTGTITFYDAHHKGNLFAPAVMGECRALVYVTTAAALAGEVTIPVIAAAAAVAAYVVGLTYAARQESLDKVGNLWPLALLAAPMVVGLPALQHGPGAIAIYLLLPALVAAAVWLLASRPAAGSVSRAVGSLIAGISLCDAALLASTNETALAITAVGGFVATLVAQKYVAGT